MSKNSEEILNCPHCNNKGYHVTRMVQGATGPTRNHAVQCMFCKAQTDWHWTKTDAIRWWNTRHHELETVEELMTAIRTNDRKTIDKFKKIIIECAKKDSP